MPENNLSIFSRKTRNTYSMRCALNLLTKGITGAQGLGVYSGGSRKDGQ